MRARLARNGVGWTLRRSGDESQHLKAVPGEDALGWRELGFAPVAINRRAISTAFDFDAGEHVAHRRRQRRAALPDTQPPPPHPDPSKPPPGQAARSGPGTAPRLGDEAGRARDSAHDYTRA